MEHVYFILFWVGVIYTIVTFFLGGLLGAVHLGFHGNADGFMSPLKPITIVSFITVFGGIGIIGGQHRYNGTLVCIVAAIVGGLTSFLLYKFLIVPLSKAQNTSAVFQEEIVGITATVISPIIDNGFGTIAYIVNGSKYNAPAQHVSKKAVKQGEKVIIYAIKNNIFYVEPLNSED